ncbi:hypothetical protein CEC48_12205 [Pseudomonas sp. K2I15]|nr:hypothetical protein CEC48_12205 [Pseudomonas sp. K2I15]
MKSVLLTRRVTEYVQSANGRQIDAFSEYFVCLKSIEISPLGARPRRPWLRRIRMLWLFNLDLCITLKITLRDKRLTPMIQPSTAAKAGPSVFCLRPQGS